MTRFVQTRINPPLTVGAEFHARCGAGSQLSKTRELQTGPQHDAPRPLLSATPAYGIINHCGFDSVGFEHPGWKQVPSIALGSVVMDLAGLLRDLDEASTNGEYYLAMISFVVRMQSTKLHLNAWIGRRRVSMSSASRNMGLQSSQNLVELISVSSTLDCHLGQQEPNTNMINLKYVQPSSMIAF